MQRKRVPVHLIAAFAVGLLAMHASDAFGQAAYWDKPSLLRDFFAKSERVTYKRLGLTDAQRSAVRERLGYVPPAEVTVYYGLRGGKVDGFAFIDNEMGQHEPITFAVLLDPQGSVQRLEIMVYREAYGDEVRENRFRNQFRGKTPHDPVRHGTDVVAVSGATISSKAMATGVRRALVLFDELLLRPGLASSLHLAGS